MTLSLSQSATALAANVRASFQALNGTSPYAYAVLSGGAGGTVDGSSGVYIAPASVPSDPSKLFDTIKVTDHVGATATAQILVGTPLLLFCDIIQTRLGLANGRVYLWDQKISEPTDSGLYVAVSVPRCRPYGNGSQLQSDGLEHGAVHMVATVDINIISRDSEARDRKEEVLLALSSAYSRQQQDANSFYVAPLPNAAGFLNLSQVDGAAIPYRYQISINMMYMVVSAIASEYFTTISVTEATDP